MAMKQPTKRFLSLALALALIFASFVVFSSIVRPVYKKAQEAKAEIFARERLLENQQNVVSQINELKNAYQGEDELAQVVSLALPLEKNESNIVHVIDQLARFNRLVLQQISLGVTSAEPTRISGVVKPMGTITAQIQLLGSYEDFKTFLRGIETDIRIFDIQSVNVTPPVGSAGAGLYVFEISVVAYYQNL